MSETKTWTFDRLLIMLLAMFGCLLAASIIEPLVMSGPKADTPEGKFVSTVIHVVFFNIGGIACVGLLLKLEKRSWSEGFGFNREPGKALTVGLAAAAIFTPIMMLLQAGIAKLITPEGEDPAVQQVVQTIENTTNPEQLFFYGFLAIVLAPVIEELLFRGIFYVGIKAAGYPRLALWGTAIMFGLIHATPLAILPLALLAVVLAKLYDRTGNLLAPIIAHAFFNAINFILVLNMGSLKRMLEP